MVSIRHSTLAANRPSSGLGATDWDAAHIVPIATQAEAIAGLADDKLMTPERVGQAIAVAGREEVEAMLIAGTNVTITAAGNGAARTLTIAASGGGGGSVAWADISGKPTAFAPSAHTHIIGDVTGLQAALDGKQAVATVLTNTTAAFTTAQETKLAGIAAGATVNAADAALRDRATHTGTQSLDTTTDSATRLAMTAAERTKLSGIATGATANAADSALRDRATHTGTQAISTVTGLQTALDGKVASNPTGITGADAITNIVSLTQAEYDAIPTKNASTFYVVTA